MKLTREMLQATPWMQPVSSYINRYGEARASSRLANMVLSEKAAALLERARIDKVYGGKKARIISTCIESHLSRDGSLVVPAEAEKALDVVRREWGVDKDEEAVTVALRWLARETLAGRVAKIEFQEGDP